jgi:O-methyltransferase
MNIMKLITPDFLLGKIMVTCRSLLDSLVLIVKERTQHAVYLGWLMFQVKPHYSMVTNKNLITLYDLVQRVNKANIAGAIVECGVWNGGSAAVMAMANHNDTLHQRDREMWLFDSFEGVPRPTKHDGAREQRDYFEGWNKGQVIMVQRIFARLRLAVDRLHIVPGWFENTIQNEPVNEIAILHIDADWYQSVKLVLETFYDRVVPGGYIILNDYGTWEGCERAFVDFTRERGVTGIELTKVEEHTGAYFQKPA